jgi:hypothetical protein
MSIFEIRIEELEKRLMLARQLDHEALQLQAREYGHQIEGLYLAQKVTQEKESEYIRREYFEAIISSSTKKIEELMLWRANMDGKIWAISLGVGAFVTAVNIAIRYMK